MTQVHPIDARAPENARSTELAIPEQTARRRRWWRPRWPDLAVKTIPQPVAPTPVKASDAPPPATPQPRVGQVAGDRRIRRSSVITILLVAFVGTAISSWHAFELVRAAGEPFLVALGYPLLIDGVIFMASMNILQAARRGRLTAGGRPVLAWVALIFGALVTLAVNVAHGWSGGLLSQLVSAIPPLAVIVSYELLMKQIRLAAAEASITTDVAADNAPQPPREEVAEPPATPAPPARTLAEAILAARAQGGSIRGIAKAFETTRSRVEAIIRQAEGDDEEAAEEATDTDVDELIEQLRGERPQPAVNGSPVPDARVARSGLGGGV